MIAVRIDNVSKVEERGSFSSIEEMVETWGIAKSVYRRLKSSLEKLQEGNATHAVSRKYTWEFIPEEGDAMVVPTIERKPKADIPNDIMDKLNELQNLVAELQEKNSKLERRVYDLENKVDKMNGEGGFQLNEDPEYNQKYAIDLQGIRDIYAEFCPYNPKDRVEFETLFERFKYDYEHGFSYVDTRDAVLEYFRKTHNININLYLS